ncbi:hypothetical protein DITRI_Ditri06bG0151400 [Diplodiscus trichospermus]
MFDGVPDQFHQFIASSASVAAATARTRTVPLPISFPPLHNLSSSNGFTSFDPLFTTSNTAHHHHVSPQMQQQPPFLHPLHHQHQPAAPVQKSTEEQEDHTSLVGFNMEIERERSMSEPIDNHHPWSNDEVLALLRIRSSMENWLPEFTWEHVSRKLAELGFKRSAEKCKEKFEEESRYFNSINCSKNYRIFSELEQLCQGDNPPPPVHHHSHHSQQVVAVEKNKNLEKSREDEDNMGQNLEDDSRNIDEYQTSAGNNASADQDNEKMVENKANNNKGSNNKKRRKRLKEFEMLKGFCEDIVSKLMSQQEEIQNKLIEDMVKRDEEKVAREKEWKKQELERINQELELRAKEQAVAGDRQATIIKFLSKFSSSGSSKRQCLGRSNIEDLVKVPNEHSNPRSNSSSLVPAAQNPNPTVDNQNKVDQGSAMNLGHQNSGSFPIRNNPTKPTSMEENPAPQNPNPKTPTSSEQAPAPQNLNSVNARSNPLPPTSPLTAKKAPQNPTSNDKEDLGKRWPRDEVLALINLRCSFYNNGDHDKAEGAAIKAPLWERISQGMLQLGYKRSAKRCKEKWENINKYFRKTKDVHRKRSLDSRTCPYFHQLSTLYNQGTSIAPPEGPQNHPALPENHSNSSETGIDDSSQKGAKDSSTVHVSSGETNMVPVPGFEFEF